MKRIGSIALLMALPLSAMASTVWKGDFETGNLSQWTGKEAVSSDRLLVVPSPAREGKYALKVTVKKGDDPINASGNRNELFHFGKETEGSEYYYKWSTMFAPDFPTANTWQLFTQWHHDGSNGSPPLEFYVRGERIYLRLEGRDDRVVWNAPLERGKWLDFILHVKWSSKADVGFVELYYNGKLALPRRSSPTLFKGMQNYLKLGLYRDESINPVGVIYHDGMVQATSLEDVMPAQTASPTPVADAAPTPAPAPEGEAEQPTEAQPSSPEVQAPETDSQTPLVPEVPAAVGSDDPDFSPEQQNVGCSASGGSLGAMGLLAALTAGVRLAFRRRDGKRS